MAIGCTVGRRHRYWVGFQDFHQLHDLPVRVVGEEKEGQEEEEVDDDVVVETCEQHEFSDDTEQNDNVGYDVIENVFI